MSQNALRLIQNILYNNLYIYKIESILEPSGYIKWIEQLDSDVKDSLKKFINFVITYVQ